MSEIDDILKALGGAEVPAGLEERVLRRLAATPVPERRWFAGWMLASGAALAVMVVVAAVMLERRAPVAPVAVLAPARRVETPAVQRPEPQVALAGTTPKLTGKRTTVPQAMGAHTLPPSPSRLESFPAPPMPLTDQEKSLLAVVRGKDLPKFAAYNPENRDELIAQGRAEFNEFFPQPLSQEAYFESHRQEP